MTASDLQAVETFYGRCLEMHFEISWGTGKDFGWLNTTGAAERARDRLKELVAQNAALSIPDDYAHRWLNYPIADWSSKAGLLADALRDLLADFRAAAT